MTADEIVGSLAEPWRFPVKSMGGEQLEQAEVTETGVLGDRAFFAVAPSSNTPGILGRRALPAGRIATLDANKTSDTTH
ncbi:MAG TPA: MOSC N-terminal beta barrel domain-containing protein [Vicinamibacterales bacterium]|nr:MOSC N-terminal beta barrel domain-containing protein [Vicinamibacterales bacterium]